MQYEINFVIFKNSHQFAPLNLPLMRKYLLFIVLCVVFTGCQRPASEWTILFDGQSAQGLRGYGIADFPEDVWVIEDGSLVANPDTANRDLVSRETFEDFDLYYEWAVDTAANSGVFFHVQEAAQMEAGNGNSPNWMNDYEIQILDDLHFYDTLAVRSAGAVYDLIAPKNKVLQPIGQFNKARLQYQKGVVRHWLNGVEVVSFALDSMKIRLAESKFKENPVFHAETTGHIMFQHHGQRVYFRDIRVKRL